MSAFRDTYPDVSDLIRAVIELDEAIINEGVSPRWHHKIMQKHRREWPILWTAIDHAREALRKAEER